MARDAPWRRRPRWSTVLLIALWTSMSVFASLERTKASPSSTPTSYTCFDDASWAVNTQDMSSRLPQQKQRYQEFMRKCALVTNSSDFCQYEENWRMQLNMYQPQSVYNYTRMGFAKQRAPEALMSLLREFWDQNRNQLVAEWSTNNKERPYKQKATTYHNHWDAPTSIVRLYNRSLVGGGKNLQRTVTDLARLELQKWTSMQLAATSTYGIRVYHNQSILTPHVDRLPLVISAIINVDQDLGPDQEPWPLEIYDHEGKAYNVTMEPGDMVFYESHSIIHGRPFPFSGNYFANVFVHFEPIGPLLPDNVDGTSLSRFVDSRVFDTTKKVIPPYLVPGSPWEPEWRQVNPDGWHVLRDPWIAIHRGDLPTLRYMVTLNPQLVHANADDEEEEGGWQPLFAACRRGELDIVQFLVEQGANVNAIADEDSSEALISPLVICNQYHGADSAVSVYLRSQGARLDPRLQHIGKDTERNNPSTGDSTRGKTQSTEDTTVSSTPYASEL